MPRILSPTPFLPLLLLGIWGCVPPPRETNPNRPTVAPLEEPVEWSAPTTTTVIQLGSEPVPQSEQPRSNNRLYRAAATEEAVAPRTISEFERWAAPYSKRQILGEWFVSVADEHPCKIILEETMSSGLFTIDPYECRSANTSFTSWRVINNGIELRGHFRTPTVRFENLSEQEWTGELPDQTAIRLTRNFPSSQY